MQASGFELYRLCAMLGRVLDDPKWVIAVQKQLLIGQRINYYTCGSTNGRSLRYG